jgi:phosphoribosylformylglycinamidine synthase
MSAYMPDVRIKATPDIKEPGDSLLIHIDLANGKRRLGGSALAQVHKQMGNEFPDLEDVATLVQGFEAIQELISKDLVSAYHDVSGGGLSTTVMEMAFAGNCGINLTLGSNLIGDLFAEELGTVIEVKIANLAAVQSILDKYFLPAKIIGRTTIEKKIVIWQEDKLIYTSAMQKLRGWWQEISATLIAEQTNNQCGQEYAKNVYDRKGLNYQANFDPQKTTLKESGLQDKNAFVLRFEGTNGEEEMRAFTEQARFKTYDVNITDLLDDKITLDNCDLLLLPGGFSFADVPDSAKGAAAIIRSNPKLAKMFADFYTRPNTLSLGVCNGCQLSTLLNLVPIRGLSDDDQPRLIHNLSGRFEHHWVGVKIPESPAIIFKGMAGSILGIHSAHGEGYFKIKKRILNKIIKENLVALYYVDDNGEATESYPFNPNGSPLGIAGLTTKDGRHTVMMPHPERAFKTFQWHYLPKWQAKEWGEISPWVMLLTNAFDWLQEH